ncbi:putative ribonuclease H-like domain-containing protein [Tanacetum coccineum]
MKKMYCLVVTDDFSRFSWVFFLATKDETSEILKTFITGIENLIDLKVKVIRCDNGTEFKNRVMNQFCEMKGIKREFSVARTPQQNRVAERKNRTLIEAARTMLADSKLPTTFWAEAVNTACYVQNRVLVIKPHNKTPYELFLGRKPALSFMRPFGCPVTILNTIDHLGKFDGKADEGFFVGYSTNSKAFRVQKHVMRQNLKDSPDVGFKPSKEEEKKDAKDPGNKDSEVPSTEEPREDQRVNQVLDAGINSTNNINNASDGNNTNNVNAVSSTVNAAGIEVNVVDPKISIELPNDPNMSKLEDIVYLDDDDDVGAEADMNNLDAFMPVSPIPTIRIHKDHLVEQIIRDLHLAPQTRRMTKNLEEHGERFKEKSYVCQPSVLTIQTSMTEYTNKKHFMDCIKLPELSDVLLAQVYVDDIIFGSTKKSLCTEFEKMMHKKFKEVIMGELTFFLGLQVKQKEYGDFYKPRQKFWSTAKTKTVNNETQIHAKVEGKTIVISESSVRRDLQFDDEDEPITVPSSSQPKKTHRPRKSKRATEISQSNGPISLVADETVTKEREDRMERAATTASSLEAEQDSGNINRTQSMATLNEPSPQGTGSETTKTAQAKEIASLKKRVKKLERKRKSRTQGMNLFKIGTSRRRSLGEEDASKQGRNLKQGKQSLIFEESDFDDEGFDADMDEVFKYVEGDAEQVISAATDEVPTLHAVKMLVQKLILTA